MVTNEPPHDKTNKIACAHSKDSDQKTCLQGCAIGKTLTVLLSYIDQLGS